MTITMITICLTGLICASVLFIQCIEQVAITSISSVLVNGCWPRVCFGLTSTISTSTKTYSKNIAKSVSQETGFIFCIYPDKKITVPKGKRSAPGNILFDPLIKNENTFL